MIILNRFYQLSFFLEIKMIFEIIIFKFDKRFSRQMIEQLVSHVVIEFEYIP